MHTCKTFNIPKWKPHIGCKLLQECEKFDLPVRVTPPGSERALEHHVSEISNRCNVDNEALRDLVQEYASLSCAPSSPRVQGGRRAAKESAERAFRVEQRVAHLGDISSSLKRNSDSKEESNALVLFGMGHLARTAEDVAQRDVFLRNLRVK